MIIQSSSDSFGPGDRYSDSDCELPDDTSANDVYCGKLKEGSPEEVPFRILATLKRGSQFTILPSQGSSGPKSQLSNVPVWHSGNIYELSRAPPNAVELPSIPYDCHPTTYDVFVSGDYEVH